MQAKEPNSYLFQFFTQRDESTSSKGSKHALVIILYVSKWWSGSCIALPILTKKQNDMSLKYETVPNTHQSTNVNAFTLQLAMANLSEESIYKTNATKKGVTQGLQNYRVDLGLSKLSFPTCDYQRKDYDSY